MAMENVREIPVKIRKLQSPEDARQCAKLMSASEPWITLRRTFENSLKMLTDSSREVYLGTVDGRVVGFIVLIMSGAFVGFVQTIGVAPEWRNQGIGTRLLKFAEDMIFEKAPNVFMCVSSFNDRARKLYERLGYEVIGELKDYIVPGHSEILLRKSIAPLAEFKVSS